MEPIRIIIPGKPIPQERPTVTRYGTFDRPKSKARKKEIWLLAMKAAKEFGWIKTHRKIGMWIDFIGANPNADIDNLQKLVLDSMAGVLWENDRQIYHVTAKKHPLLGGEQPLTAIVAWDYPEES